jgi:hypothetical protein
MTDFDEILDRLDLELYPWQREIVERLLAGEQFVIQHPYRAGRRRAFELALEAIEAGKKFEQHQRALMAAASFSPPRLTRAEFVAEILKNIEPDVAFGPYDRPLTPERPQIWASMSDRTGFQDRCIQPLCHPSRGATEDSSTPKSLTSRAIGALQRPFITLARYARDLVIEPHRTSVSEAFGPYNCPSKDGDGDKQ